MRKPLFIARQGRKPSGLLGAIVARIMAKETVRENEIALELLGLVARDDVVEIGCGHGETLAKAAHVVREGALSGIDFSWTMHRYATRRHRRLVRAGRLELRFGSSDRLPFEDRSFDKAYSVHTIYFWTAPLDHLREIRRVLRPGGRLVLGFRPGDDPAFEATFPAEVYWIRPQAEVAELVRQAGFDRVCLDARMVGGKQMSFVVAEVRHPTAA